ncbi:unnamed protein product [Lampetra planeri]
MDLVSRQTFSPLSVTLRETEQGPPLIHPIERRVPSSTGSVVVVVVAIVITIIARRTTPQRPCDVDAASVNRELRL